MYMEVSVGTNKITDKMLLLSIGIRLLQPSSYNINSSKTQPSENDGGYGSLNEKGL